MLLLCKKCGERSARIIKKKDFVDFASGGVTCNASAAAEAASLLKVLFQFAKMLVEHFKDRSTPIAVCEKCGHYEKADI